MLALLKRKPLQYEIVRQKGSHRVLESKVGYRKIGFWCHDKATLKGSVVRDILVNQVGLSETEARELV
jgi:predicted RNA binding protein YcfA (HicA-like mRNA interferase family)